MGWQANRTFLLRLVRRAATAARRGHLLQRRQRRWLWLRLRRPQWRRCA